MQTAGLLDMLELSSHMYASLFMLTGGIPRLINNLLKLGIEYARINNRKLDDSVVSAVISDQASSTDTGSNIHKDHGHE